MNLLDDLLRASEEFARDKLDALPMGTQEALCNAVENGCLLQIQVTPCAQARVRFVLLTPDGKREMMQLGYLVDGQPH